MRTNSNLKQYFPREKTREEQRCQIWGFFPCSFVRKCAFDWYLPKTVFSIAYFWWLTNVQNSNLKRLGVVPPGTFSNTSFILSNIWNRKTENENNCTCSPLLPFPWIWALILHIPARPSIPMNFLLSFLVTGLELFLWKGRWLCHPVEDRTCDVPLFASFSLEFFY